MLKRSSRCALAVTALLTLARQSQATPITIFATGVDGSGTPLADATIGDPHYILTSVPGPLFIYTTRVRTAVGGTPIGPWLGDDPVSAWIGPNTAEDLFNYPGTYTYRTTFDLTGLDPTMSSLSGQWATDDLGTDILINGVSTGNTALGFSVWSPFAINGGFLPGVNTLDFLVLNGGISSTGLRVEITGESVPEPAALVLLGSGLAAVVILRRRQRAAQ